MAYSICVLWYLLLSSHRLAPEFFHFVVCLTDNQGNLLWVFCLWTCFKEGFTQRGAKRACQDSVFAVIEMLVALGLAGEFSLATAILFLTLIVLMNVRQKQPGLVNTALAFFALYYTTLNFSVNLFDFCYNFMFQGLSYRHDNDFVSSFSYKSHQLVLILGLTFVSLQFVRPSFTWSKELPIMLALMHCFSIIVAVSLFFNFLFELTSMKPSTRFKVFRVELVKVFISLIVFYFLALVFTTWQHSIAQAIHFNEEYRTHRQKALRT